MLAQPLRTARARLSTSLLHEAAELMDQIQAVSQQAANLRVMALSVLIILAGHYINGSGPPVPSKARGQVEVEENITAPPHSGVSNR